MLHRRNRDCEPYQISNGRSVYEFMRGLDVESAEHTYELLLDVKHRVHGVYLVGKGGIDNCHVDPAEVFKAALVTNSPAFILVHNHPSGIVEPSLNDVDLTSRIFAGADILNLQFLDNMIVGDGRYLSFLEVGRMPVKQR